MRRNLRAADPSQIENEVPWGGQNATVFMVGACTRGARRLRVYGVGPGLPVVGRFQGRRRIPQGRRGKPALPRQAEGRRRNGRRLRRRHVRALRERRGVHEQFGLREQRVHEREMRRIELQRRPEERRRIRCRLRRGSLRRMRAESGVFHRIRLRERCLHVEPVPGADLLGRREERHGNGQGLRRRLLQRLPFEVRV